MADFKVSYALTMTAEGGYANNKLDAGGETYAGVARNFWPGWPGWVIVDATKAKSGLKNIDSILGASSTLQGLVAQFYKTYFWDVNRLDAIVSQEIANKLFDVGVNMGTGKASRMLQEALNLTNVNGHAYPDIQVDGIVGPQTVSLTNTHPRPKLLLQVLKALQGERYLAIMRANASQEAFAASWFSRV